MADGEQNPAVRLELVDDIGMIIIDNPPINAGSKLVRRGLLKALQDVKTDDRLTGAVIAGAGKIFMAGSDLSEFDHPLEEPQLPAVIKAIETMAKPVVAAIAGAALGGGYELALGCDARIASRDAVVGLPETRLGMIPGAGGTQRLPRLTGQAKAIELICAGTRVAAPEALQLGMIDSIAVSDLGAEARGLLHALDGRKRRVIERAVPPGDPEQLEQSKSAALKSGRARPHIRDAIKAVEDAGRLAPADGLAVEREVFQRLRIGREAAALRHLFFAERSAAKVDDLTGVAPKPRQAIGVIGGGTMGAGIAAAALDAGKLVTLAEATQDAANSALHRIDTLYAERLKRGRIGSEEVAERLSRLTVAADIEAVASSDVVIEAVFEDLEVKRELFEYLGRMARPDAVLLTNTSYLSVSKIAAASGRDADVAGLHFFSPADVMRLVEVVRHPLVAPATLATAVALARELRKLPVVAKDAFGFVGNRIYAAYRRQCEFMLEEGALPEEIDQALEAFGFAMGPFAVADMSGLDIAWRMRQATAHLRDLRARYVRIPDLLCERGRLGRKTGSGYYRYGDGRKGAVDPEVTNLILDASRAAGIKRRSFSPNEIVLRALASMASEAALLISEGVTNRPTDVDLVLVNGYGFPRHEGGPLFWARRLPEAELKAAIDRLVETGGPGFKVGPVDALRQD
ncbi:MAG: 3-hydroxyacyl-CoA dehydrogenase [Mesorhizobium sp.]|nr:MAG: 3-hydroxyacyl-CoA dehydrogenase [Mesorhizobium sp.]